MFDAVKPTVTSDTHLSDGQQQFTVGVEDDAERQQQTEDKQTHDVGDVVQRLGLPVHGAGGPWALWPITAPAQERRNCPDHRVETGEADPSQGRAEIPAVGYSGRHHGTVAFVGDDGQNYEGENS